MIEPSMMLRFATVSSCWTSSLMLVAQNAQSRRDRFGALAFKFQRRKRTKPEIQSRNRRLGQVLYHDNPEKPFQKASLGRPVRMRMVSRKLLLAAIFSY